MVVAVRHAASRAIAARTALQHGADRFCRLALPPATEHPPQISLRDVALALGVERREGLVRVRARVRVGERVRVGLWLGFRVKVRVAVKAFHRSSESSMGARSDLATVRGRVRGRGRVRARPVPRARAAPWLGLGLGLGLGLEG